MMTVGKEYIDDTQKHSSINEYNSVSQQIILKLWIWSLETKNIVDFSSYDLGPNVGQKQKIKCE